MRYWLLSNVGLRCEGSLLWCLWGPSPFSFMKCIATFSEPLLEPTCSTPLLSCSFSKIDFQKISFSHGPNSLSFYFLILNKSHFNKLFLTIFILGVNDFFFIFISYFFAIYFIYLFIIIIFFLDFKYCPSFQ